MKRIFPHIILSLFSFFFLQKEALAQKTDTIIHINRNVLTGDFKKLVYGVITYKMDGMGTISFEETKVNTIISKKQFEIKMHDGTLHFGSMDSSGIYRKVKIIEDNDSILVNLDDIVEIYPIKRNFWMRTSGNFSLGVNYSKGSGIGTIALSGNMDYRKKKSYFNLTFDTNNTYQGDSLTTAKGDIDLAFQRFIRDKWSASVGVGLSQNTQLGTKRRLNLTTIGIYDILYNHWNRFYTGAGFGLNRETPFDDSGTTHDLAGAFQLVWKVYKYTYPKLWVDANIQFLPYLTNWGRYRATFNLNPQISIINDNFKIGFSSYIAYDSQPLSGATSTTDYGINLQLTYKFH